ncbi:MAG: PQQ-dependent sugar dehydrogenase [Pseudomonadota bacterium]
MRWAQWLTSILMLIVLTACGGGSGGGNPGVPPIVPPPAPTIPSITTQAAFTGVSFTSPVALRQAPGDNSRWFVVQKGGVIRTFANDPNANSATDFLDITAVVTPTGEGGLLGLAFHPNFPATPYAYVSYTRASAPLVSYVSRFSTADGGLTLDAGTEMPLFTVEQFATNHNGGDIAFGPDGFLYVAFGDGGGSGDPQQNGQNTMTLPGTIVRIDVDSGSPFVIPPDNPFAGNGLCTSGSGAASCPEIFAWGFRNPWRFSFDTVTGKLWAGDVGQGSWEEIDVVELGGNYGWNVREGANCFSPSTGCGTNFTDPITEYPRGSGGSVTGGYVYRGTLIPDLVGWYVFGDFITGQIYAVPEDSPIGTVAEEMDASGLSIVSFGQDQNGEVYVVDFSGTLHMVVQGP